MPGNFQVHVLRITLIPGPGSFQSLESEYSLKMDLKISRHFLFYRFATKISKTVFKTRLKTKETKYTLSFGKYPVVSL
jgi:hypothetical protein